MKKMIHQDSLEIKPPNSITGAENTRSGIKALIDWFGFTFTKVEGIEGVKKIIKDVLNMQVKDFIEMPRGGNGYKSQLRYGDIAIFYDGKSDMGIHVCMTGQGCRQYEAHCDNSNTWRELCNRVVKVGGHCSRLDPALDDYRGKITVEQIAEKAKKRELRTFFKKAKNVQELDLAEDTGINDGGGVYFGSGQSDVMIRFYNKAVQQGVNYPWVRTEIQCRDERADLMMRMIACGGDEDFGKIIAGVLRHYINFLKSSKTDTNKARWSVCSWWDEFLGTAERVRLTTQKAVKTIEEKMDWVVGQVATTAALIHKHFHSKGKDSLDYFFKGLIDDGMRRLKPHHYALLQAG